MKKLAPLVLMLVLAGCTPVSTSTPSPSTTESLRGNSDCVTTSEVIIIPLTEEKHSEVILHAKEAIAKGYPRIMILNRQGASERRKELLADVPTKEGFDRDEYAPASGRTTVKADVKYVTSKQNRSAGAVMGNVLRKYCDGTRFEYAHV